MYEVVIGLKHRITSIQLFLCIHGNQQQSTIYFLLTLLSVFLSLVSR